MSIHFITGKPGGGKSLVAVKYVVDELVHGTRTVVTNLGLKLPELNEYLQREFPFVGVDIFRRIRILEHEEVFQFWLHRGLDAAASNGVVKWVEVPPSESNGHTDYTNAGGPVMFVIDETHVFFGAREWAKNGKGAFFYLSQHRHLGDKVMCVTHVPKNVDRQFASVAQDFMQIRNHSKEKLGPFKLPNFFTFRIFQEPFTGSQSPSEFGTFRLNVKGLASCYDTSAGVGIGAALTADKQDAKKGWPIWLVFVAIAILGVGLYYGPGRVFGWVTGKVVSAGKPVIRSVQGANVSRNKIFDASSSIVNKDGQMGNGAGATAVRPGLRYDDNQASKIWVTGIVRGPRWVKVYLSDDRVLTERTPGLDVVTDSWIVFEGRKISMKTSMERANERPLMYTPSRIFR